MDCKAEGTQVLIFPEGTRNHNPEKREFLKFKTGAFSAAIGAQVNKNYFLIIFKIIFLKKFMNSSILQIPKT